MDWRRASQRASQTEILAFLEGGVGDVALAVDGESAALQRAVIDVQGNAGRGHVEGAPGGGGAPETAVAGRGFDGDGPLAAVVAEAADGEERAPCGHGAGVMMAALGLVPGVALLAI